MKNFLFYFKAIPVIVIIFVLSNISLRAEDPPYSIWCNHDNDDCGGRWHRQEFINYSEATAFDVIYYWRQCSDGRIEVIIDFDNSYMANSNFFNRGSYEERDFEGWKEYIEMEIMESLFLILENQSIDIPDCDERLNFFTIYSARCGVYVKCSYELDVNADVQKDGGYTGDCPSPIPKNGTPYVDVWKWQPCGTVCCKKDFTLCKEYNPHCGYDVFNISGAKRNPAPGEECSQQDDFTDWRTGNYYNCIPGCNSTGNP